TVVLADLEDAHPVAQQSDLPTPSTEVVPEADHAAPHALEKTSEPLGGGYMLFRANGNLQMGVRPLVASLESRSSLVVVALPPLDSAVTAALVETGRSVAVVAQTGRTLRRDLERTLDTLD